MKAKKRQIPRLEKKVAICVNCGRDKGEHVAVNWCNGNLVSGDVAICPGALWVESKWEKVPR